MRGSTSGRRAGAPDGRRRKAILPYILISLACAVALGAGALGAAGYARRQEQKKRELEEAGRQAALVLEGLQDLMRRHPDFDLNREQAFVGEYQSKSQVQQAASLPDLEALYRRLEQTLVEKTTGRSPGLEGWGQALAYKTFSPNGFRQLYESLVYPYTQPLGEPPEITGDPMADARIVRMAAARGYRLRSEAEAGHLAPVGKHQLQESALLDWQRMQRQALSQGIRLELVSGYRSIPRQRAIFLSYLQEESRRRRGREYTPEEIASGRADGAIDVVLASSSIPGFSRHHTGYTIDLNDPSIGKDFTDFAASPGFLWLSAGNYLNAKRFGFIPSYPDGASTQGPEPEPWEYVWVGEELLRRRELH